MTMRTIIFTSIIGLSLGVGACDKGESASKEDPKATANRKVADAKAPADARAPADAKAPVPESSDDEVFDERVIKAADLAEKIEADPSRTDEVLAQAGMDRAAFNTLIYEVSTPELAEQYRLARARSSR